MTPTIKKVGTNIELVFPPREGASATHAGNSHTIRLPITPAGQDALMRILGALEAMQEREPFIATEASPIQSMVDAWLREGNKVHKAKASVEDMLEAFGLD